MQQILIFSFECSVWLHSQRIQLLTSFVCLLRSLKYVCTTIIFMQSHISLICHFIFSTKIFITTGFIITNFTRLKSHLKCTKYYVWSNTHTHARSHIPSACLSEEKRIAANKIQIKHLYLFWPVFRPIHTAATKCCLELSLAFGSEKCRKIDCFETVAKRFFNYANFQ